MFVPVDKAETFRLEADDVGISESRTTIRESKV